MTLADYFGQWRACKLKWRNDFGVPFSGTCNALGGTEQGAQFWRPGSPPQPTRDQPTGLPDLALLAVAVVVGAAPIVTALYAYVVYPLLVWAIARTRNSQRVLPGNVAWPSVTITIPVYNSAATIRDTLDAVLALDYPADRCQVLVLSDASNDGTDAIVREYAVRGVQLLRAPTRRGKTAAENAAVAVARGEIIVNIDATVRVLPNSLKPLIRAFADPTVGVASGRDVSSGGSGLSTAPEAAYTGYEMKLREWETIAGSIVGASGCFYGIRRRIRNAPIPPGLSWDFASTLVAARQGYRSVSVTDAVCVVPRTARLQSEMSRKARTMGRGLSTLVHFRDLMNPLRYGGFALMLISHKLLRWVPYLLLPPAVLAWAYLAANNAYAAIAFGAAIIIALAGVLGITIPRAAKTKPVAIAAFVVAAAAAGLMAWIQALRGARLVTWDPTPRPTAARG